MHIRYLDEYNDIIDEFKDQLVPPLGALIELEDETLEVYRIKFYPKDDLVEVLVKEPKRKSAEQVNESSDKSSIDKKLTDYVKRLSIAEDKLSAQTHKIISMKSNLDNLTSMKSNLDNLTNLTKRKD